MREGCTNCVQARKPSPPTAAAPPPKTAARTSGWGRLAARRAPSASGEAKPSLEGRGDGRACRLDGGAGGCFRPAPLTCPPSFTISTGTETEEIGPERWEAAGWAPEERGAEGGAAGTGGGGGSVCALGETIRAPPSGTIEVLTGMPERNGFSKLSRTLWGRERAGLGPMLDTSIWGRLKTAPKASANSLAVWKRWVMSRLRARSNQVVKDSGRSGR